MKGPSPNPEPLPARLLGVGLAAAAALAALSLIALDQTTSVDASNWLIWARQAAVGNPVDPAWAQTSFKPLPVLFALPFSVGSAAAGNLTWLWLVRFGFLVCPLFLFALASRRFGTAAGFVAAILPLAVPTWVGYAIAGDSEPVVTAMVLAAALAAAASRDGVVTGLLSASALIRPEAVGLTVIWLAWLARRWGLSRAVRHLAAATAAIAGGWLLLPELIGFDSGQAAEIAKSKLLVPNSRDGILSILPTTVWLLVALGAWALARRRRDPLLTAVGAAAALWTAEVVALAGLGFPGVDRYLYPAAIALCAIAGAGAGAIVMFARGPTVRIALSLLLVGGSAALAIHSLPQSGDTLDLKIAKADSAERAVKAFESSGGIERWRDCRPFAANLGYSVIVARMLGEPLADFTPVGRAPTIAFMRVGPAAKSGNPFVTGGGKGRIVGFEAPDWTIVEFAGRKGCGR